MPQQNKCFELINNVLTTIVYFLFIVIITKEIIIAIIFRLNLIVLLNHQFKYTILTINRENRKNELRI